MSLILEALKKSEAERQRGRAPGLFVEQSPLADRRRGAAPAWAWALAALLVAVLAVFGWREWSRMQAPTLATPSPQPSPASGRGSESAPIPAVRPAPPPAPAREPMPARASRPEPAREPSPQPSPASGRGSEAPAPAVPPLPQGEGPGEGTPEAEPALPRLADLPGGERAALPPLKLTMHVYADDPAARFVILDGRRLGEGGMLGEGVLVREIRRDGVVLESGGRALLLPRP